MKKLLALILALTMVFALVACGEKTEEAPAEEPAPTVEPAPEAEPAAEPEGPVVEVPADQVEEEQAKADADFATLKEFGAAIDLNRQMLAALAGPMTEAYAAGEIPVEDVLTGYQEMADQATGLLATFEATEWQTEYYADHITALSDTLNYLAGYSVLISEAMVENDEAKMGEANAQLAEYQASLDEFLTLMGV